MKIVLILVSLLMVGCETLNEAIQSTEKTTPKRIALHWENTDAKHSERIPWSDALITEIDKNFSTYDSAQDVTSICPKYKSLTKEQKLKAYGEFFVALSFYESGYNPKSNSVDVGTKEDKGSWSVGLFQMSVNDDAAKKFKATFSMLQDPIINIKVAVEQMRWQIVKTGKIIIPVSSRYRYWAPILLGSKYYNANKIIDRTKEYTGFCSQ